MELRRLVHKVEPRGIVFEAVTRPRVAQRRLVFGANAAAARYQADGADLRRQVVQT